jgi:hypothetical protein
MFSAAAACDEPFGLEHRIEQLSRVEFRRMESVPSIRLTRTVGFIRHAELA